MDLSDFKFVDVSDERVAKSIELTREVFPNKTEEDLFDDVMERLEEIDYLRAENFAFLQTLKNFHPEKIREYLKFFPNNYFQGRDLAYDLTEEKRDYLDFNCKSIISSLRTAVEENRKLSFDKRKAIKNTWGQFFSNTTWDLNLVSRGKDNLNRFGPNRFLVDYEPIYDAGRVVNINYNFLHPQTIGNIVKPNGGLVDIIRINSSQVAVNRINCALNSVGLKVRQDLVVNFPLHRGNDAYFEEMRGPDYTIDVRALGGSISDIIDKTPIIIVQENYGKGKYNYHALMQLNQRGFFDGRTVFHYILEKRQKYGEHSLYELNQLNFLQISSEDLKLIQSNPNNGYDLPIHRPRLE